MRIIFFAGKGGVGKTSVAAATLVLPTPPLPAKKIILTKSSQKLTVGSGNLPAVPLSYHKAWISETSSCLASFGPTVSHFALLFAHLKLVRVLRRPAVDLDAGFPYGSILNQNRSVFFRKHAERVTAV